MHSIIQLLQTIFYPFWYFFVLAVVYAVSKFITMFFVASGRLKSFHAIENYWIYFLITLFCVLIGVLAGYGNLILFCRWFLCSLLAGIVGIHFGFDKGISISDDELQDIENEIKDEDSRH
jgi:hypothetical protein